MLCTENTKTKHLYVLKRNRLDSFIKNSVYKEV